MTVVQTHTRVGRYAAYRGFFRSPIGKATRTNAVTPSLVDRLVSNASPVRPRKSRRKVARVPTFNLLTRGLRGRARGRRTDFSSSRRELVRTGATKLHSTERINRRRSRACTCTTPRHPSFNESEKIES